MRTAFALATLAAVSLIAGCNGSTPDADHGSAEETIAMNYDEASRIVVENFKLVWPDPIQVEPNMVDRGNGCRTNPETLKSEGPPWTPIYEKGVTNPSQEFIDRTLAQLEAMTVHGFTLRPDPIPDDDPINRVYADSRGFTVAARRDRLPAEIRFTVTSSSPCVND